MKMGKKVREYKAGDFIFAKVKGYPAWPARVQRQNGKKYFVYFYGTDETANLPPNMIFDYAENKDKFLSKPVKRRDFNDGVKQIEHDFANNVPLEQVIGLTMEAPDELANETVNDSAINETMDESTADTTAADDTVVTDECAVNTTAQNETAVEDSDETGALVIDEGKKARKPVAKATGKETPKPMKEPRTPRGKKKEDAEETKEEDKKEEEIVSRSGRKIRPKRYMDEQTDENATLPSPAPKKRRGASPAPEKEDKPDKAEKPKGKHFNTVALAELEDMKEPFNSDTIICKNTKPRNNITRFSQHISPLNPSVLLNRIIPNFDKNTRNTNLINANRGSTSKKAKKFTPPTKTRLKSVNNPPNNNNINRCNVEIDVSVNASVEYAGNTSRNDFVDVNNENSYDCEENRAVSNFEDCNNQVLYVENSGNTDIDLDSSKYLTTLDDGNFNNLVLNTSANRNINIENDEPKTHSIESYADCYGNSKSNVLVNDSKCIHEVNNIDSGNNGEIENVAHDMNTELPTKYDKCNSDKNVFDSVLNDMYSSNSDVTKVCKTRNVGAFDVGELILGSLNILDDYSSFTYNISQKSNESNMFGANVSRSESSASVVMLNKTYKDLDLKSFENRQVFNDTAHKSDPYKVPDDNFDSFKGVDSNDRHNNDCIHTIPTGNDYLDLFKNSININVFKVDKCVAMSTEFGDMGFNVRYTGYIKQFGGYCEDSQGDNDVTNQILLMYPNENKILINRYFKK